MLQKTFVCLLGKNALLPSLHLPAAVTEGPEMQMCFHIACGEAYTSCDNFFFFFFLIMHGTT